MVKRERGAPAAAAAFSPATDLTGGEPLLATNRRMTTNVHRPAHQPGPVYISGADARDPLSPLFGDL